MEIQALSREAYQGMAFTCSYKTNGYYDLEVQDNSFRLVYKPFPSQQEKAYNDRIFSEWLDDPIGFGAFSGGELLGFAEGFHEKWNNRYRISNIFIFDESRQGKGLGRLLIEQILQTARNCGARMAVVETQTCNERAIAFYQRMGFQPIGFDLFAYSNSDPEQYEVRLEMGLAL